MAQYLAAFTQSPSGNSRESPELSLTLEDPDHKEEVCAQYSEN
jgi:hypothetical protein